MTPPKRVKEDDNPAMPVYRAHKSKGIFTRFAERVALWAGHPAAATGAACLVLVWAASGPIFGFSETWQLVINTGTTIITFLMVFLIQNSQNRDTAALHLKLDELIRTSDKAQTALLDLEELSEDELNKIRKEYELLAEQAREKLGETREKDPDAPILPPVERDRNASKKAA